MTFELNSVHFKATYSFRSNRISRFCLSRW